MVLGCGVWGVVGGPLGAAGGEEHGESGAVGLGLGKQVG